MVRPLLDIRKFQGCFRHFPKRDAAFQFLLDRHAHRSGKKREVPAFDFSGTQLKKDRSRSVRIFRLTSPEAHPGYLRIVDPDGENGAVIDNGIMRFETDPPGKEQPKENACPRRYQQEKAVSALKDSRKAGKSGFRRGGNEQYDAESKEKAAKYREWAPLTEKGFAVVIPAGHTVSSDLLYHDLALPCVLCLLKE